MSVFSPESYQELLDHLLDAGYVARSFHDADASRKDLIIRHDVDMSIDAAVRMARIEGDMGVSSIYFLLTRSLFYNLHHPAIRNSVLEIIEHGHQIGLHFDAALYESDICELDDAAARECAMLEQLTSRKIDMISFHRPAQKLLGLAQDLGGRAHTYNPTFFNTFGYVSDSRGAWLHGRPEETPAFLERRGLQLLTHPIWWMVPGDTPQDKLNHFLAGHSETLKTELAAHCSTYR